MSIVHIAAKFCPIISGRWRRFRFKRTSNARAAAVACFGGMGKENFRWEKNNVTFAGFVLIGFLFSSQTFFFFSRIAGGNRSWSPKRLMFLRALRSFGLTVSAPARRKRLVAQILASFVRGWEFLRSASPTLASSKARSPSSLDEAGGAWLRISRPRFLVVRI